MCFNFNNMFNLTFDTIIKLLCIFFFKQIIHFTGYDRFFPICNNLINFNISKIPDNNFPFLISIIDYSQPFLTNIIYNS